MQSEDDSCALDSSGGCERFACVIEATDVLSMNTVNRSRRKTVTREVQLKGSL